METETGSTADQIRRRCHLEVVIVGGAIPNDFKRNIQIKGREHVLFNLVAHKMYDFVGEIEGIQVFGGVRIECG